MGGSLARSLRENSALRDLLASIKSLENPATLKLLLRERAKEATAHEIRDLEEDADIGDAEGRANVPAARAAVKSRV